MDKRICLKCGGFYINTEMNGTICVWCSIQNRLKAKSKDLHII
jgi:uncharacterized protein CbrC (UPF0167 family)